jgi:hypothetical protein
MNRLKAYAITGIVLLILAGGISFAEELILPGELSTEEVMREMLRGARHKTGLCTYWVMGRCLA